jgi:ditrans,polycis-polyprenyl diphosphate synthase
VEYITELTSSTCKDVLLGALRQGPVPQHMAFVMDGNRRFARSHKKEVAEGHSAGFEALARVRQTAFKSSDENLADINCFGL